MRLLNGMHAPFNIHVAVWRIETQQWLAHPSVELAGWLAGW
jgi:hypothetical protein